MVLNHHLKIISYLEAIASYNKINQSFETSIWMLVNDTRSLEVE